MAAKGAEEEEEEEEDEEDEEEEEEEEEEGRDVGLGGGRGGEKLHWISVTCL